MRQSIKDTAIRISSQCTGINVLAVKISIIGKIFIQGSSISCIPDSIAVLGQIQVRHITLAPVPNDIKCGTRTSASDVGDNVIGRNGRQESRINRGTVIRTVPKAVVLAIEHCCKALDGKVRIRKRYFKLPDIAAG